MKARVRKFVNSLGFDVVRATTLHRDLGAHVKGIIDAKAIDGVIDVGANVGQYGRMLRLSGFEGQIYSFEPVSKPFRQLERTAASDAKWHCFNIALGEEAETREINVYEDDVFSSFLSANDYSKQIWSSLNEANTQQVSIARLDDLIDSLPSRDECHNFLLKMDTQGFDLQVFRGAKNCLSSISALQSELALIPIYDGSPNPFQLLDEFKEHGFFISGMYVINRDASLAVVEYDVTFVKRDVAIAG